MSKEWWQTLFDEKYIKTYVDKVNPELTKKQIKFLINVLNLEKNSKVLFLVLAKRRYSRSLFFLCLSFPFCFNYGPSQNRTADYSAFRI